MHKSKVPIPAAYRLAEAQRPGLRNSFENLQTIFRQLGYDVQLSEFVGFIEGGSPSINMSVSSCARFLDQGMWLNIYEAIQKEKRVTGRRLANIVRKRLRNWYLRRRELERLLRFRRDTHYTALNLGGSGAARYGPCCVILDTKADHNFATALAGDSLRAVFDANGKKILTDAEILSLYSIREDASSLAAIRCRKDIESVKPGLDPTRVRGLLENSDSLVEIHLHGPVHREHVRAVLMARGDLTHLWDLAERSQHGHYSNVQEFDVVPSFLKMVSLLKQHKIPLRVAEIS